jgi:ppGpp synthetase/RelA/SpoT-type nucleotidyltranferase
MKTERSNTSQKIEQMRNQLENLSNVKNVTHMLARRIKNMRTIFAKKTHPNQHQQAER